MANLIAQIEALGAELRGESQTKIHTIKLKESNGKVWEWSTFHESAFDGYKMGDVIEIVPELKWKEGRKSPYRNIGSVVGKREASEMNTLDVFAQQPSQSTPQSEAPESANGTYDQGKPIERRSIERQTSLKLVVELFKAGCNVDDLESVVDAVIKAAIPVEEHLARQGALATIATVKVPDPDNYGKFVDAPVNGTPSKAPDSYKMETVGDLFTAVLDRYKKTPGHIFEALDVDTKEELLVNSTIEQAWGMLQSIWEGPPAKKTEEEQEEIVV